MNKNENIVRIKELFLATLVVLVITRNIIIVEANPFSNKDDRTLEFHGETGISWAVETSWGQPRPRRQYQQVCRPQLACRRQCLNNPQGTLIDSSLVRRKCD